MTIGKNIDWILLFIQQSLLVDHDAIMQTSSVGNTESDNEKLA